MQFPLLVKPDVKYSATEQKQIYQQTFALKTACCQKTECLIILLFLLLGLVGYSYSGPGILKDLSVGTIALALGMFGFL